MSWKLFSVVAIGFLIATTLSGCSAIEAHHKALFANEKPKATSIAQSDPISGEWNVMFYVQGHNTPATFRFKLDGQTVTGTAYSDHTGAGTIRDGKWADGKLSFTLDFQKHESISVTGALKDGSLAGQFTTEGFTANWDAKKK